MLFETLRFSKMTCQLVLKPIRRWHFGRSQCHHHLRMVHLGQDGSRVRSDWREKRASQSQLIQPSQPRLSCPSHGCAKGHVKVLWRNNANQQKTCCLGGLKVWKSRPKWLKDLRKGEEAERVGNLEIPVMLMPCRLCLSSSVNSWKITVNIFKTF